MSPLYAPLAAGAKDDDLIRTLLPEEVTVSSVVARAVGTGHHMLKVEGYSRLKHTRGDNGSPVLSGEFRAGGHTWKIRCYLDGVHKGDAGFVSLYLSLADPGTSAAVHAEVEFELVDQWPLLPLWCRHRKRLQVSPFQPGKSWGFPRFIGAGALEGGGSRFLKGDYFAVRCKITVVEEQGAMEEEVQRRTWRGWVWCACARTARAASSTARGRPRPSRRRLLASVFPSVDKLAKLYYYTSSSVFLIISQQLSFAL